MTLLDKACFPRVKPCAEYANPAALEVLERLGLRATIASAGAAVFGGMRLVTPNGAELAIDFRRDDGRHALGVSRFVLDALALERARAVGVRVVEGAHVRALLRDGERVVGVRATIGGQPREWHGSVVVGADGHHSSVARLLGLDRPPRWPRRIGLAAHYVDLPLRDGLGEMHVGDSGYCGLAPQEEQRVNVAMVVELAHFERRSGSVAQFFEAELHAYPHLADRLCRRAAQHAGARRGSVGAPRATCRGRRLSAGRRRRRLLRPVHRRRHLRRLARRRTRG